MMVIIITIIRCQVTIYAIMIIISILTSQLYPDHNVGDNSDKGKRTHRTHVLLYNFAGQ